MDIKILHFRMTLLKYGHSDLKINDLFFFVIHVHHSITMQSLSAVYMAKTNVEPKPLKCLFSSPALFPLPTTVCWYVDGAGRHKFVVDVCHVRWCRNGFCWSYSARPFISKRLFCVASIELCKNKQRWSLWFVNKLNNYTRKILV